jgi:hypothetical protein
MSWGPRYKHGDTVWVDRGAGVELEGQIVNHLWSTAYYTVAVAGQGLQEVPESDLRSRPRQDYGPGPEESE